MDLVPATVVSADVPFTKCIHEVLRKGTAVFVEKNGKIIGLIDDRNFKRRVIPENMKAESACVACPVLSEENTMKDILDAFLLGHFKALPYIKDGQVYELGRAEVMEELLKYKELHDIPVRDIMSSPVITVDVHAKIRDVRKIMKEAGVHHVVVMDGKRVVGTFTTFDLLAAMFKRDIRQGLQIISEGKSLENEPIYQFVRTQFVSIREDASLREAMQLMASRKVSSLLVMRGPRVVGLLGASDIFRVARKLFGRKWSIQIAGLSEDTVYYHPMIKEKLRRVVSKFEKSFNIGDGFLRVKEGKSVYELSLHLPVNNHVLIVKVVNYELEDGVAELCEQLERLLKKEKEKRKGG